MEKIVAKICSYLEDNDTRDNYVRVMRCCCECIKLVDWSYFETEEKENINQGIQIWNSDTYNSNMLEGLFRKTIKMWNAKKKVDPQRMKILDLGVNLLASFEHWKENIYYRPYNLEFFTLDLVNTGVKEEKILPIIKKHFPEFI